MKHIVTLDTDELDAVTDGLAQELDHVNHSPGYVTFLEDLMNRLNDQLENEIEDEEPWG